MDVLCCTASIYLLLAISIDRYIGVTRPLRYNLVVSKRRIYMLIAAVWCLSLSVSLAGILWKSPPTAQNVCEVNQEIKYVFFSASISFYIPLIIILIIYYRIYKEARIQMEFLKTGTKTSKTDGKGNSITLRVHIGPTQQKQRCSCHNNSASLDSDMHGKLKRVTSNLSHLEPDQLGMNKLSKISDETLFDSPKSDSKSLTLLNKNKKFLAKQISCPMCSSTNNLDNKRNLSNTNLPNAFSSKLAKFKREKKAAKNLAIVVGELAVSVSI